MATLALSLAGSVVGGAIGGPIGATIGRAVGALAGSAIDAALFAETPPETGRDLHVQGSGEGGAIPRIYGWNRLAGNIIWATELERISSASAGAKGTASRTEEVIAANFAIALCQGEVPLLGRIWADGQLLNTEGLNIRFYSGAEAQLPDSLIAAKQGAANAPAYRGTCYLVFEALPLKEFGNRIPSISVEVCRPAGDLESRITAITLIPGATEFGYDPVPRVRILSPGTTISENAHAAPSVSDWTMSLDQLQTLCPNLKHVSLVTAWFGDDLRCGTCSIAPRVESANRNVDGVTWTVSGIDRNAATPVSSVNGGPAYGGTPSDAALIAAIADLKARGLSVTLYPLVMMDIPSTNTLTDPYSGTAGQPSYPWRGRIVCDPAPGTIGTVDQTSAAATQIGNFVGAASGGDFAPGAGTISYSGPAEWSYRRMVLHYAHLSVLAGGIDAFILGSEMRGLTTVRAAAGDFPFVDALVTLAADVRAILGTGTRLTYAADWSEYHGLQPADAPGDKIFHLDPLWASPAIDAVGIDNYMPIADWRDGDTHADASAGTIYSLDYLGTNIVSGEGYDWYYASSADRLAQNRSPILDGAYGEPWVFRFKDIVSWWSNAHYDRIGGVRAASPTGWIPQSKPVWLTELGCGAVDKGANLPSAFADPKSSENARPWFSSGAPDALMQRQFLRAHLGHWQPGKPDFVEASNPRSSLYSGRMLDPDRIYLWTWDARPFPAFPSLANVWADGPNYATGHWLSGRLGNAGNAELIAKMAADFGVVFAAIEAGGPLVAGLAIDGVTALRDTLDNVLTATRTILLDSPAGLICRLEAGGAVLDINPDDIADFNNPRLSEKWPMDAELPAQLGLSFADRSRDYVVAGVTAVAADGDTVLSLRSAMTLDQASARGIAGNALAVARQSSRSLDLTLPPSHAALEPGDRIQIAGRKDAALIVTEIRDGAGRRISARPQRHETIAALLADGREIARDLVAGAALPVTIVAQLPADSANAGPSRLVAGAFAAPWPGDITLADAATGATQLTLTKAATIGELVSDLRPAPSTIWDRKSVLDLVLYGGHLASETEAAVLNGANRLLIINDNGQAELIGFTNADLVGGASYRLTGLLRGLLGTGDGAAQASSGARIMLVDNALAEAGLNDNRLGSNATFKVFAGSRDVTGQNLTSVFAQNLAQPLMPGHYNAERDLSTGDVVLTWIRRSRLGGDSWTLAEMPLDASPESYRITIRNGATVMRVQNVTSPSLTYSAAEQIADFGALPASFDFEIAQVSAVYGPGRAAIGAFNG